VSSTHKNRTSVGFLAEVIWFLKGLFPTTPPVQFWCKEKQPATCISDEFCRCPITA